MTLSSVLHLVGFFFHLTNFRASLQKHLNLNQANTFFFSLIYGDCRGCVSFNGIRPPVTTQRHRQQDVLLVGAMSASAWAQRHAAMWRLKGADLPAFCCQPVLHCWQPHTPAAWQPGRLTITAGEQNNSDYYHYYYYY